MLIHALLVLGLLAPQTGQSRLEAPPKPGRASAVEDLTKLSVRELVGRQPLNPWLNRELAPVVAEMLRRAATGQMSDDEWRSAFEASGTIRTQIRWPIDTPLQIGIKMPVWLQHSMIAVRAIEPDLGEVSFDDRYPSWCGNCQEGREERAQHLKFAELPAGITRVAFEVTVTQREGAEQVWPKSEASREIWKGRLVRQIMAVTAPGDVLPESRSEADTKLVRDSFGAWWSTAKARPDTLIALFRARFAEQPAAEHLAVSLTIELWDSKREVGHKDLVAYARAGGFGSRIDELSGSVLFEGLPPELDAPEADLSGWTLRVRANAAGVPGIWGAERWWNGKISVPLSEALKPD